MKAIIMQERYRSAPPFALSVDSDLAAQASPAVESGTSVTLLGKLNRLRTTLVDEAFILEQRGQLDAADLAISTARRIGELCDEFSADSSSTPQAPRKF